MPRYVVAYHGGRKFETPQQGVAYMAKWRAWVDSLGDALIDPGTPLGKGKLVSSRGISERGADSLTGFSIVAAGGMDGAVQLAQRCPHLDHGTIEIAEVMEMKMK